RSIYYDVCDFADLPEQPSFVLDSCQHVLLRQRVRAPGLAVAPDQQIVVGLQEDNGYRHALAAQLLANSRERPEELSRARVDDKSSALDRARLSAQRPEGRNHLSGKFVNGEITEILEGLKSR